MTPPGRAASPLDSLAPDQRAALELVVRQGRSYGELANLLGIPEAAVQARAHGALEALAPDLPPPPDAGELADFLLGQQDEATAERTRARLADDSAAQRWVMTVAAPLGELKPAAPPSVAENAAAGAAAAAGDLAAIEDVDAPAPRASAPAARPRPLRRGADTPQDGGASPAEAGAAAVTAREAAAGGPAAPAAGGPGTAAPEIGRASC